MKYHLFPPSFGAFKYWITPNHSDLCAFEVRWSSACSLRFCWDFRRKLPNMWWFELYTPILLHYEYNNIRLISQSNCGMKNWISLGRTCNSISQSHIWFRLWLSFLSAIQSGHSLFCPIRCDYQFSADDSQSQTRFDDIGSGVDSSASIQQHQLHREPPLKSATSR